LGKEGLEYLKKEEDKLSKIKDLSKKQKEEELEKIIVNRLKGSKNFTLTKKFMNMFPETILAAPRAILTIALIPPILKYVFGWEKKKPNNDTQINKQTSSIKSKEGKS
jgi:hypothetical protein